MGDRYRLTSVETVHAEGSWLFTVQNSRDERQEVFLVPCEDETVDRPVNAWVNNCTHEAQRLHREGIGAVVRDGGVVCPKHGSVFDACSGYCDNGEAADSTLLSVDITVEDGQVYLTDGGVDYLWEGPAGEDDDDDDMPSSTSHLQL
jgi:nitrite reductase/ring-hydroxylating ferredoxin subunit